MEDENTTYEEVEGERIEVPGSAVVTIRRSRGWGSVPGLEDDELLDEQDKSIDAALFIDAEEEELVRRLSSRWTCRNCQAVYNVLSKPPLEEGKCDLCGGELYQRADDKPETVRNRIVVYREQTSPLVQYYRDEALLVTIKSEGGIGCVQEKILEALDLG